MSGCVPIARVLTCLTVVSRAVRTTLNPWSKTMSKYQRTKGHAWEREVARRMRECMPGCNAKRGLQTQGGAADVPDVEMDGPLHIECKVGAKPPVRRALNTAVTTCPDGKIPVAVIKEDRKVPYVVLQLEDFEEFLREWWYHTTK